MPAKSQKKIVASGDNSDEDDRSMMDIIKNISSQLAANSTQLSNLTAKMDKIDVIENEVKNLRVLLSDLKSENTQLKAAASDNERKMAELNERNNSLEDRLNNLEQHHRGWGARILNIPLTPDEETDNDRVRDIVYNLALRPILEGAVAKNLLRKVPTADQLLETAHVLPGKAGQPKPIIMRFYNRNVRDACFVMKKHYAPRVEQSGGGRGGAARGGAARGGEEGAGGFEGRGRYLYPLYEDLTRATFLKLRAITNDERVKACWSIKGQIRFVLHKNEKEVRRVQSLLTPLDDILK
jgi:FtsZ-binding cell division protein ZapB